MMFDRLKIRIFRQDENLRILREVHAKSVDMNTQARENLLKACEKACSCKEKKLGLGSHKLCDIICLVR